MRNLRWLLVPLVVLPLGWLLFTGFGRDPREIASPLIGRSAPEWISTSSPSNSRMTRALYVVRSSGALPATVVMPSRSVWRAATTIATASSWPGSQSRMIDGRGMTASLARGARR